MFKSYYWVREKKNGKLSEGRYSFSRRVFGRVFIGGKFTKIGEWMES